MTQTITHITRRIFSKYKGDDDDIIYVFLGMLSMS
jgi:hypothetical protein